MLPGMAENNRDLADRLLTRAEVERRTGLARTSVYRLMREGAFPEPLRVGRTAVRWPASEIEAWISSRPRAHGDGVNRAGKVSASA